MFKNTPYAQAFLKKQAFVPYTQEAMNATQQPPQDGQMPAPEQGAQGAPPPPEGEQMPPAQGGAPQIQTQPGPNGEPIDVETGFIVIDMQNGIEQDPLTGILFNKFENSFATPEGQPLDPQQAQQILEQAYAQQAEQGAPAPEQGGEAAPQEAPQEAAPAPEQAAPVPEQGAPVEAPVPQAQPGQSFDPSTGMMIDDRTGLPVDPNTGMLVDPQTGQQIDPQTGMPVQQGAPGEAPAGEDGPFTGDPEVQKTLADIMKRNERTDKQVAALSRNINATRTDIQGVRREVAELNDNQDVVQQRIDNLLSVIERLLGPQQGQ